MQTIDDMPEEDTAAIRTHQHNQKSLSSINNHHSDTLDIPKHALSSCPNHVDLDDYVYPNLDPATATQDNQNSHLMIKHIIVDFVSKWFRTTPIYSNHERTLYVDRVVPILSVSENHHQNIHFEW